MALDALTPGAGGPAAAARGSLGADGEDPHAVKTMALDAVDKAPGPSSSGPVPQAPQGFGPAPRGTGQFGPAAQWQTGQKPGYGTMQMVRDVKSKNTQKILIGAGIFLFLALIAIVLLMVTAD